MPPVRSTPTVSFMHSGDERWASYRYRAQRPAASLGASLNDAHADVLIFSKPVPTDLALARRARQDGRAILVDFCDDHFERPEYVELALYAQGITCATATMAAIVLQHVPTAVTPIVVDDPYEFAEMPPHLTHHGRLLWFGHPSNLAEVRRIPVERRAALVVVSSGAIPGVHQWSPASMIQHFAAADIVLLPAAKPWKSPNRAIEALRQGCFVLAEPHPSRSSVPFAAVHVDDLARGLDWYAAQRLDDLNGWVAAAQLLIRHRFSLDTVAEQWRRAIALAVGDRQPVHSVL